MSKSFKVAPRKLSPLVCQEALGFYTHGKIRQLYDLAATRGVNEETRKEIQRARSSGNGQNSRVG